MRLGSHRLALADCHVACCDLKRGSPIWWRCFWKKSDKHNRSLHRAIEQWNKQISPSWPCSRSIKNRYLASCNEDSLERNYTPTGNEKYVQSPSDLSRKKFIHDGNLGTTRSSANRRFEIRRNGGRRHRRAPWHGFAHRRRPRPPPAIPPPLPPPQHSSSLLRPPPPPQPPLPHSTAARLRVAAAAAVRAAPSRSSSPRWRRASQSHPDRISATATQPPSGHALSGGAVRHAGQAHPTKPILSRRRKRRWE